MTAMVFARSLGVHPHARNGRTMIRTIFIALMFASVAACQPGPTKISESNPSEEPRSASVAPGNPVGDYRIAEIDGDPPAVTHEQGVTVSIGPDRIHYTSQCVYGDWTWRIADGAFTTRRAYEPGTAMCARGLSDGERAIEEVFDDAKAYAVLPNGHVAIEGGGRRMLLAPLPAQTPPGPNASAAALPGQYDVRFIDGKAVDLPHPMIVTVADDTIRYDSQCIHRTWNYRLSGARLMLSDPPPEVMCQRGNYPEEVAIEQAISAVRHVERGPDGSLSLQGDGHTVVLVRR